MKRLFLIVFIGANIISIAQDKKQFNSAGLIFDQDFLTSFIGLNEDRNYTQGLGFNFTCFGLRDKLNNRLHLRNASDNILNFPTVVSFQIAGFTPDDLRNPEPIKGDRPYSSVLFFSLKDYRVDQEKLRGRYWTTYVGVLGIPNVAKNGQTFIHELTNKGNTIPPYNPEGWSNQISNGGEPTFMLSYGVTRLLTKQTLKVESLRGSEKRVRGIRGQATYNWQVDLGYLTQINAGGDYRIGLINLKKWHNSGQQWALGATAEKVNEGDECTKDRKKRYFSEIENNNEIYLFIGFRGGLLIHNSSLHGQFKPTEYKLPYHDTRFFRASSRLGLTYNTDRISITAYGALKNSEFNTDFSRTHFWGGISANLIWAR